MNSEPFSLRARLLPLLRTIGSARGYYYVAAAAYPRNKSMIYLQNIFFRCWAVFLRFKPWSLTSYRASKQASTLASYLIRTYIAYNQSYIQGEDLSRILSCFCKGSSAKSDNCTNTLIIFKT